MPRYTLSSTGIDDFLHHYFLAAWNLAGNEYIARGACSALARYVGTGRSSLDFDKAMLRSDPAELAKISLLGGSDDEIIQRIRSYINKKHHRK